ncbi:MAG TPA: MOSC N-terminal beta barrel domain-containing protein [Jatrophihabitans sp.]|nr:MOSC N-terminal beta barrel domain-containing protein [Jatrophihabitans sp.]
MPVPVPVLSAINRYPVKSCRGHGVQRATVEPWGLAGDRRWLLVDDDGVFITAREHPSLMLVTPAPRPDGGLDVTGPDAAPISVDVPERDDVLPVRVWKSELVAAAASPAASAWFSKVIGKSVRLVYLDDPTRRRPNPVFAQPSDYVSFADGYPLLLATQSSLDMLNDWIAEGPRADEGPLPMTRFRPNVVIAGTRPWEEDGWRRIRVGEALFRVVKGCDRCTMTMTDPDTAERGKEPISTLARYRRWDGETWFGMNIIPDTPFAEIAVGDEVEILEAVPAPNGPPR